MKKPGLILSVIIVAMLFIYSLSFISAQNVCTGVRAYQCVALQQSAPTQPSSLPKQIQQTVSNIFTPAKSTTKVITPTQPTTTTTNTNTSASASLAAQQQAAAAQLAQQQAATAAAQQQAAAQQAAARLAAQQAAAQPVVNTTTRAS